MKPFKDKKIIITGGALRIGRAISETFINMGGSLRVHYNSSIDEAYKLKELYPSSVELYRSDFASPDIDELSDLVKDCDILINNASIFLPNEIDSAIVAKNHIEINYNVPCKLMELFGKYNKSGSIINILDAKVVKYLDVCDSYYKSKYLLLEATKTFARKLAPNIRVNGIALGSILPPSWLPESKMKKSIEDSPLKYQPSLQDVSDAATFLSSNKSITGNIIFIDSGIHLN